MASISIIVALASDNAIGKGNDLLFHIPGDLKRFKEITTGHSVIMGRKTYLSLPRRPLPNRRNIVITRDTSLSLAGCTVVHSVEAAIALVEPEGEAFVIGGGEIYNAVLPYADKLYLTLADKKVEGADVFFPSIKYSDWELLSEEKFEVGQKCDFSFRYSNYKRVI